MPLRGKKSRCPRASRTRAWNALAFAGTAAIVLPSMWHWWLVVCLAIFLIGVTKSGFGSGMGLMVVPMTAIAMGHLPRTSEAALGLLLPLLVLGDFIAIYQYRHLFRRRKGEGTPPVVSIIARMLPGTLAGLILGGLLLWWFHRQTPTMLIGLIRLEIGFESMLLVGIHWWRQYRGVQSHLLREPWRSHLTGSFAGASSTLAHAAGPIVSMYLLPLKLDRQLFVGTSAFYFFLLNTAKLPVYFLAGQFAKAELSFTLRFAPLVLAGAIFGFWVNKRMSDKLFMKIVYALTFAMGCYMLVDGAAVLSRR